MDKQLIMALANDVKTSMKMLTIALDLGNITIAENAVANAENELASIREMLQNAKPPSPEELVLH